jgi:hypothetical protein
MRARISRQLQPRDCRGSDRIDRRIITYWIGTASVLARAESIESGRESGFIYMAPRLVPISRRRFNAAMQFKLDSQP